jgi:DNA-binding PadR family transcriptional regulator
MTEQRDVPDGTELNASERDLLFAIAGSMEGPGTPTIAEVRRIAVQTSERFAEESNGNFYNRLDGLVAQGLVTKGEHGDDARTKVVGFTQDGEQVLQDLYERAEEAVDEEFDG